MAYEYRVRLFGITEEIVGSPNYKLVSENSLTSTQLLEKIQEQHPQLKEIHSLMLAVNQQYAQEKIDLKPGDEIALIPPVSGG